MTKDNERTAFEGVDTRAVPVVRSDNEGIDPAELTISHMEGAHPHAERIKKKVYLSELRDLQVELLKLQQWVKNSGERIVVLFEGRDAAGKGGAIRRFTENIKSTAVHARWLSRSRTTPNADSGTSSATSRICRLLVRWCSSIAPGTTGRASRSSWGSALPTSTASSSGRPGIERSIVESGTHLFKFWFTVSRSHPAPAVQRPQGRPAQAVEVLPGG